MKTVSVYAIWCHDELDSGDWLRETRADGIGIIAFLSKRAAQKRAAQEFNYDSYSAAKRDGWCDVRTLAHE